MKFAYAGGSRVARWDYGNISGQWSPIESRFYTLGGKEIRMNAAGAIRSVMFPIYGGSARRTQDYSTKNISDEFLIKNRLGSTVRSWGMSGDHFNENMAVDYDAWGKQIHLREDASKEELAQRFTGKERDWESGLDYFGWRFYDSDVGVWLSPDPMRQLWNPYGYMGNFSNPLNYIDSDGLEIDEFGNEVDFTMDNVDIYGGGGDEAMYSAVQQDLALDIIEHYNFINDNQMQQYNNAMNNLSLFKDGLTAVSLGLLAVPGTQPLGLAGLGVSTGMGFALAGTDLSATGSPKKLLIEGVGYGAGSLAASSVLKYGPMLAGTINAGGTRYIADRFRSVVTGRIVSNVTGQAAWMPGAEAADAGVGKTVDLLGGN